MSKRTSSLLIDEQPLQVIPSLAAAIGVNEAILLQQINYWVKHAEKSKDERKLKKGRWWTYNTYADWQEQMPWMSVSGIRKLVKKLKDLGLVAVVKYKKQAQDHTLWYTVNYDAVDQMCHIDVTESDTSMCPEVTHPDVTESDTSYIESESPESQSEIPVGTDEPSQEKSTNYFDVFTEAAKALGYEVTPEDRKELPGNLKKLAAEHGDAFMRKVVRRCLAARADRQYPLSPQRARDELQGAKGGVKTKPPPQASQFRGGNDHALVDEERKRRIRERMGMT